MRWVSPFDCIHFFHDDDDDEEEEEDPCERERQKEHVFKRKSLLEATTKTTIISSLFSNPP